MVHNPVAAAPATVDVELKRLSTLRAHVLLAPTSVMQQLLPLLLLPLPIQETALMKAVRRR